MQDFLKILAHLSCNIYFKKSRDRKFRLAIRFLSFSLCFLLYVLINKIIEQGFQKILCSSLPYFHKNTICMKYCQFSNRYVHKSILDYLNMFTNIWTDNEFVLQVWIILWQDDFISRLPMTPET